MQLRIESAHEEGGIRDWSVAHRQVHRRRERQREAAARHPRWPAAEVRADPGHRVRRWTPIWCCSRWASPGPVRNGMIEQLGVSSTSAAMWRPTRRYMSSVDRRLRRGRYAPRPVAGGLGDRRRPQSRPRRRRIPESQARVAHASAPSAEHAPRPIFAPFVWREGGRPRKPIFHSQRSQ